MKKSVLNSMRKGFKAAEAHNKKVKRLEKQLRDPMVLQFITDRGITLSSYDFTIITEEETLDAVMRTHSKSMADENNGIYFSDGVLIPDMGGDLICFRNLENPEDEVYSWIENREAFEQKHIVVYGDDYEQVQREFVLAAIKYGQEEAVELMASKRLKGKREKPYVKTIPTSMPSYKGKHEKQPAE